MITTPLTADLVRGASELEPTGRGLVPHRLPARARAQNTDPRLAVAEAQPAGVRLRFRTTASVIELETLASKVEYPGAPPRPDGVYDLVVDGKLTAQATAPAGVRFTHLPGHRKDVEIWLPHNELTTLVALRTDAPVLPIPDRGRVWLHHGSSISQGSNALSPATTWPALTAASAGAELVNLGFSGNALLDPFTARAMRDTPADLISVELGINIVNADLMRLRAFGPAVHGFLDTIREGHPAAPLLVVSPLYCPIHERTPGPGDFDHEAPARGEVRFRATGDPAEVAAGKLTLEVIRESLARLVAERADSGLHYLDGRALYGPADYAELPLPDELHPDAASHRRIASRFTELAFGGPFA
ncbi:GDSL-type esterase/lipase family protein [Amycolatopsis australiensis]|uniref:GDSL-like Lipase/Acylhydrolase family protein n=1 Tax=Amycolatopsis australiensis TaxID=546364 RepID=A0A1K1QY22_9PSEU|nr:GDSL-type esterase/lipase family protein [Amycolatopsis australiensis]SFW64677.1 GDSL-like Lipase/Acylhydrolase family protein [Amycolatopsis australiensis]